MEEEQYFKKKKVTIATFNLKNRDLDLNDETLLQSKTVSVNEQE